MKKTMILVFLYLIRVISIGICVVYLFSAGTGLLFNENQLVVASQQPLFTLIYHGAFFLLLVLAFVWNHHWIVQKDASFSFAEIFKEEDLEETEKNEKTSLLELLILGFSLIVVIAFIIAGNWLLNHMGYEMYLYKT